jgi:hypothetical protein
MQMKISKIKFYRYVKKEIEFRQNIDELLNEVKLKSHLTEVDNKNLENIRILH